MKSRAFKLGLCLLLVSAAFGVILFRRPAPAPRFDAWSHVLGRLAVPDAAPHPDGPYASSWTRLYRTRAGVETRIVLVDTPERELALAEALFREDFVREACFHARNVVTYHPDSKETARAGDLLAAAASRSAFLQVAAAKEFYRDGERGLVPIRIEAADLADLKAGRLEEVAARHPHTPLAFALYYELAKQGRIEFYARALTILQIPAFPLGWPSDLVLNRGGLITTAQPERPEVIPSEPDEPSAEKKPVFRMELVPTDCIFYEVALGSLLQNERAYKTRFLDDAEAALGQIPDILRARIYFGLSGGAPVADSDLDARWRAKLAENPYLKIEAASMVTMEATLPLRVTSANIGRIRFTFAPLPEPPKEEATLKDFLEKSTALPVAFEEELEPTAEMRLPIRKPGAYRITATARGLTCVFTAVRLDARLEAIFFPRETVILARRSDGTPIPGLSVCAFGRRLGETDADGALRVSPLRVRFCPDHVSCCSGCDSCAHHHGDDAALVAKDGLAVFASGPGVVFRATAKPDLKPLEGFKAPVPGPVLFVYTDRPVYRAGDTLRFRGVLRTPRPKLARGDDSRFDASPEQEVSVTVDRDKATLFTRKYVTGESGTFSGEFTLPLTSQRAEYALVVSYGGVSTRAAFEVMDYRKNDYVVALAKSAGGFAVKAGYVWGAPVTDAVVTAFVDGREAPIRDGVVTAKDGQVVRAVLRRGDEELASKTMTYRGETRTEKTESSEEKPRESEAAPHTDAPVEEKKKEAPPIRASKPCYVGGETIELELSGPDGEALVVLGDVEAYDWRHVTVRGGRGTARFPVRGVMDPGTTAFAVFGSRVERLTIAVNAHRMPVEVTAEKPRARPGEEVTLTVKTRPGAALSLAAVDEAIFMLREDDTPEMYGAFYTARPAAMAHGAFGDFTYDGVTREVERAPEDESFCVMKGDSGEWTVTYDTLGIGGGAGGGGRYGGRFGGRSNSTARGGGTTATESAVLASLKLLASMQQADGSWGGGEVRTEWGTIGRVGNTALALLAFMGAGYSHLSKDHYDGMSIGAVVKLALQFLISSQDGEGGIGPREGDYVLNHALAAIALSEAYGMTGAQLLRDPADRAVRFFCDRQEGDGGWHPAGGESGETPMSALGVMVLKSAQLSEIPYPPNAAMSAYRYFGALVREDGSCASSRSPGSGHTRLTDASGMLALIFLRADKADPRLRPERLPLPDAAQPDLPGWYIASLAIFKFDGQEGPSWKRWNAPVKTACLAIQSRYPTGTADRVFAAAVTTLNLEIYYRYANVFGCASRSEEPKPLVGAPAVRVYFPDTALWIPELIADSKGEAKVALRMPDSITTIRLTARGVTRDGSVGEGVGRIESQQPFFVNLKTPAFFVLGDECEIRAEVFNYTGRPVTTEVSLSGDGFVRLDGEKREVTVSDVKSVTWRVQVVDPKRVRFLVDAKRDAMEKVVPVRPPDPPVTRPARGKTVVVKEGEKPLDLVVRVLPKGSPIAKVLDALRFLNDYPHG